MLYLMLIYQDKGTMKTATPGTGGPRQGLG